MKAAGFDVGTTGLKGVIVNDAGETLAEAISHYEPSSPHPGWSEQDPEDWWDAFVDCAAKLVKQAGPPDAIGLSGQMHGSVFLDGQDRPLGPAILWNDQRTESECEQIIRETDNRSVEWTLNEPRTAFTAAKILWFRNNHPELYAQVKSVLLPKDFVRFRMSGEKISDVTDASGTNLLDVRNRQWSAPMMAALGIEDGLMPDLVESVETAGHITPGVAALTGLRAGTVIVGGGADQACAALGNGVAAPGTLSLTLGTSGVAYVQLPDIAIDDTGAFHTFCHSVPGTAMAMAGVLSAGGSLEWYRETIGAADARASLDAGGSAFSGITEGMKAIPPGSGGLVFLPYLTGERSPHNDPRARGAFMGLTRRHTRDHMAKAVVEGVCFAMRDLVDVISGMGVAIDNVHVAGGAARGQVWLTTLASVLGRPIHKTTTPDASAYGAAMLAMANVSNTDVAALAGAWVKPSDAIEPDRADSEIYKDVHGIYRSLYPATRDAMHALHSIDLQTSQGGTS